MADDRAEIVGKWTVEFKGKTQTWKWEYVFSADGSVTWRDPLNNMKGSGRWMKTGQLVNLTWIGSSTKESWRCPIRELDQTGWIDASYGVGNFKAQKLAAASPDGETSLVKQWNPKWTVAKSLRMNSNPWTSHAFGDPAVPGMIIQSQLVTFKGSVDPDTSVSLNDFELGILQNALQSSMVGVYVNSAGTPTWTVTISCPRSRDAADNSPLWYATTAVKPLNAPDGKQVESNDQPQNVVPWQTKDRRGTLVSSSGKDAFCTWLAARQKSTGALTLLSWAVWSVDWRCTFNFTTQGRSLTGTTVISGQGDGQGPNIPITTGRRAIEQTTMRWTGPAGGY